MLPSHHLPLTLPLPRPTTSPCFSLRPDNAALRGQSQ